MPVTDAVVFAVVAARFVVPLAIPRYPLPGVLASIALDAVDRSLFQALLGTDLPGYQPYDKALDVYSLSVTMLAVLRNWRVRPAVAIARALFYLRLVGVLAFELSGWRPLLVLFPNTFEYFFVCYEVVRAGWWPERLGAAWYLRAAAAVWVVVKIPQEYALHVLGLDVTDLIAQRVLGAPAGAAWGEGVAQLVCVAAAALAVAVLALGIRALAPPARRPLRLAADPLPRSIDEAHEWARHVATHWRALDRHLAEKIVLVGFLTVIFAQIVPDLDASPGELVARVAVVVTLNSLWLVRRTRAGHPIASAAVSFLLLAVTNVVLVLGVDLLLRGWPGGVSVPDAVFFLLLLSLVVTLYDRWHPVFDERFGDHGRARRA